MADVKTKDSDSSDVAKKFNQRRTEGTEKLRDRFVKKYGACYMRDRTMIRGMQRVPTGIFTLDLALGGGWAKGRIHGIIGPESGSKSTILIKTMAEAQRRSIFNGKYLSEDMPEDERVGARCLYVDIEGTFDPVWAQKLGLDMSEDKFTLIYPECAEDAVDNVQESIEVRAFDIIGIDSIAAMIPKDEEIATAEKQHIGKSAVLAQKMLKKTQAALNKLQNEDLVSPLPTVFVINQWRMKVGVMFGDPRSAPGGESQKYFYSTWVEILKNKVEYFDGTAKRRPAYGNIDFFIRKNKAGLAKIAGDYILQLADDPDNGYKAGDVVEYQAVLNIAQNMEMFHKDGNKWLYGGKEFSSKKKLDAFLCEDDARWKRFRDKVLALAIEKKI